MVVTVASASEVRCAGAALRAAVIRIAVTGGLTLLAFVFGAAVANATTSSDAHQNDATAGSTADTLQSDLSDLFNGLVTSLGGHHHHLGGVSAIQPPSDQGGGGGTDSGSVNPGGPQSGGHGGGATGGQSSSSGSDSGDVWTGSTTVSVPTKPIVPPPPPPAAPTPPPVPPVQPAAPPVSHLAPPAAKVTAPSMGSSSGVQPDLPQQPIDLPLQQPAAQPISAPSTGGTASHDLGGANGIAGFTPPGTGFRPTPGSTTEEHSAKRVSDGAPGLPSTSPD